MLLLDSEFIGSADILASRLGNALNSLINSKTKYKSDVKK